MIINKESKKNSPQGTTFYLAAQRLSEKIPINFEQYIWLMVPQYTCVVFSIEVNIKAILSIEGKVKSKSHNIEKLLKFLNVKTQTKLINSPGFERDAFWVQIALIKDAFVDWRYIYEKDEFNFNTTLFL